MMTVGGKDLLNMDFRIKPRIFGFVGAGTRFKYTRDELKKEKITAQGPLNHDVELLVSLDLTLMYVIRKRNDSFKQQEFRLHKFRLVVAGNQFGERGIL